MKRPNIEQIEKLNGAKAWGHADSAVSHCAALLIYTRELEAALAVRTVMYVVILRRPPQFAGSGRRSAYDSGYERAWRGLPASASLYAQEHMRVAYAAGYKDGTEASEADIREHVARAKSAAANFKAVGS